MNVNNNIKILPLSLLLLLFSSSCAFFLERLDKKENNPIIEISIDKKQTFCPINNSYLQLISQNEKSHQHFSKFLLRVESVRNINFIDKVVLWSLLQMNLRPDLSTPQSRIQVLINYQGKEEYLSYFQENNEWSYLVALEQLLKKYQSHYTLKDLASLIDKYHPDLFYVSNDFAAFLVSNTALISKEEALKKIYMRADEPLRENERLPRQRLVPLVTRFYKHRRQMKRNVKSSNYLFDYKANQKMSTKCNYDMGLYQSSIYLINNTFIRNNIFGIKEGKNAFLASSNQGLNKLTNLKGTLFFASHGNSRATALCSFQSKLKQKRKMWLISSDSRDPGQHIYHLLEYGLQNISQIEEMDKMLKFSRHLFLQSPVRLIFESNRSTKQQLEELLKLNIPIYYANNLGRIWGLYQDNQRYSFLLDDRKAGGLSCIAR